MPTEQLPLIPEEPYNPPAEFALLSDLLPQVTSIAVISEFLKSKDVPHSAGSWDELREKRLKPALQKNAITIEELKQLLCEVEEFGRSHTFLYKCTKIAAAKHIDSDVVTSIAEKLGLEDSLGPGRVLDQPDTPHIASIRIEKDGRGSSLVIKIVEKRIRHKYLGERVEGKKLVAEWDISEARAVNVVRLFSFGILEVRIASHQNSTRYDSDLLRVLTLVRPFMEGLVTDDFSLGKAKIDLWTNRKKHEELVRFSQQTLRNSSGSTLAGTSRGEDKDLFEDKSLAAGMGAFWKTGETYCESSNIYWLAGKERLPSKEIHLILPELRNEFAVPAACSKADYEYVFDQLRALSS